MLNFYCPEGTAVIGDINGPKACPSGTYSLLGSHDVIDCILVFTTRYVDSLMKDEIFFQDLTVMDPL